MLSGEATNTNFIVFGLTQPGLETMIYQTQGERSNYYTKAYLLTLPLFAGISRVKALSPAWTGSHARETLISRTHLFLPHDIPQQKNQVQ
jgi:hypothetical protein